MPVSQLSDLAIQSPTSPLAIISGIICVDNVKAALTSMIGYWLPSKAYSGTLTRREIVRVNACEFRRDKEKLSLTISRELGENDPPNVEVIRVKTYNML